MQFINPYLNEILKTIGEIDDMTIVILPFNINHRLPKTIKTFPFWKGFFLSNGDKKNTKI